MKKQDNFSTLAHYIFIIFLSYSAIICIIHNMNRKIIMLIRTFKASRNQHITPPLGIMSLKSHIESVTDAYKVHLLDMVLDMLGPMDTATRIKDLNPDIVGFSTFTYEFSVMKKIISLILDCGLKPVFIMGGPHSTVDTAKTMKDCPGLDYIVIGEGEKSFEALLDFVFVNKGKLNEIDGIAYRHQDKVFVNEKKDYAVDFNKLPMPSWDSIDINRYNDHKFRNMNWIRLKKYAPIFTSRACPYRCIYCHNIFGTGFRSLSPERVLNEMIYLYENYGVEEFHILDDVFNLDRNRAMKIMNYIIKEKYRFKIAFPNGLRGDILDKDMLTIFKKAGVYRIVYAVESGTNRIQKLIGKNIKLDKLYDIIKVTHEMGFFQHGFFMLGFPFEKEAEIKETLKYAFRSHLHTASFFQVVPFPSTPLYDLARKANSKFNYDTESFLYYSDDSFYKQTYGIDLAPIQKKAYRRFYINAFRFQSILRRIPSFRFLLQGGLYFLRYAGRE